MKKELLLLLTKPNLVAGKFELIEKVRGFKFVAGKFEWTKFKKWSTKSGGGKI
jgi:hypothetical protein